MRSPIDATAWLESLPAWPAEFGLGRMRRLLRALGDPQRRFRAIHVVGSNGKSTATRTIAALLDGAGMATGAYTSPHVSGWSERIVIRGDQADFELALARVGVAAAEVGATQFEVVTAAAFAAFADARVDVAVVEAGLGGRRDATNVLDADVVLLTNVTYEHADVLGETVEEIALEKLAVAHAASVVVLPDNTYRQLVPHAKVVVGGAREAAEAFAGRPLGPRRDVPLPGRLERRGEEVWDGAHTPEAADWLLPRLPRRDYVVCASVLRDKQVDALLRRLAAAGRSFVATRSSNPRALDEQALADRAARFFPDVEAVAEPAAALSRARARSPRVLVTGSLYLLADLYRHERVR